MGHHALEEEEPLVVQRLGAQEALYGGQSLALALSGPRGGGGGGGGEDRMEGKCLGRDVATADNVEQDVKLTIETTTTASTTTTTTTPRPPLGSGRLQTQEYCMSYGGDDGGAHQRLQKRLNGAWSDPHEGPEHSNKACTHTHTHTHT